MHVEMFPPGCFGWDQPLDGAAEVKHDGAAPKREGTPLECVESTPSVDAEMQ